VQIAVAQAGRLLADEKPQEAFRLLEQAATMTTDPSLQEYIRLELTRAQESVRLKALWGFVGSAEKGAALAACDEALTSIADPMLRAQVVNLRDEIQAGTPPPVPGPMSGAGETTTTTDGGNRGTTSLRQKDVDREVRSQKEAARYNEAVALHNNREYAGALRITDDLAANATNEEVRKAAVAFAARIRAKFPGASPAATPAGIPRPAG
jgi:hypothetical protein